MKMHPLRTLMLLILTVTLLSGGVAGARNMSTTRSAEEERLKPAQEGNWNEVLHIAAWYGRLDMAKEALSKGADVNFNNNDRHVTALQDAASLNHCDLMKFLFANGADPTLCAFGPDSLTGQPSRTTLAYAVIMGAGPETLQLLKQLTAEREAWLKAKKLDTPRAYQAFTDAYPQSMFADQVSAAAKQAEIKKQEQERRLAEHESKLPPTVLRDKYMFALVQLLKGKQYAEAIPYCEKLSNLPLKADPSLDYYYGECLMQTGQPDKALEKLYHYANSQGSGAPLYTKALALVNQIEARQ